MKQLPKSVQEENSGMKLKNTIKKLRFFLYFIFRTLQIYPRQGCNGKTLMGNSHLWYNGIIDTAGY